MSLGVRIQNRDFTDCLVQPTLQYTVTRHSWNVMGGPEAAEIQVKGNVQDIWWLVERLRCPVVITSIEGGDPVFWGYAARVTFTDGAWDMDANIDNMANRVAVAYNDVNGDRQTTVYLEDADSIAEYGYKELLYSSPVKTEADALAVGAMVLAQKKLPRPVITLSNSPQSGSETTGTITCGSWYDTLGWRYTSLPHTAQVDYLATTETWQNVGEAAGNTQAMQQVKIGQYDIDLVSASIDAQVQGSPTDDLKIDLFALDVNGLPTGSALSSGSVNGADVSTTGWTSMALSPAATLTAYTTYGLVVSRSGSNNATDYYQVNVNTAKGYTDGFFRLWNGSAWAARSPDADMAFILVGDDLMDTTWTIYYLLSHYGQFLTGIDIDAASGLVTNPYQNGDNTTLSVVQDLLDLGTTNYRRLLAAVDNNRRIHIYEQPAVPLTPYLLRKDGLLSNPLDNLLRKETCPVGIWTKLKDVIPGSVNLDIIADPSLAFIDGAEYELAADKLTLTPYGNESPWTIGRPKDG